MELTFELVRNIRRKCMMFQNGKWFISLRAYNENVNGFVARDSDAAGFYDELNRWPLDSKSHFVATNGHIFRTVESLPFEKMKFPTLEVWKNIVGDPQGDFPISNAHVQELRAKFMMFKDGKWYIDMITAVNQLRDFKNGPGDRFLEEMRDSYVHADGSEIEHNGMCWRAIDMFGYIWRCAAIPKYWKRIVGNKYGVVPLVGPAAEAKAEATAEAKAEAEADAKAEAKAESEVVTSLRKEIDALNAQVDELKSKTDAVQKEIVVCKKRLRAVRDIEKQMEEDPALASVIFSAAFKSASITKK